eukprot:2038761-Pyramimonas_sp.AAC.1
MLGDSWRPLFRPLVGVWDVLGGCWLSHACGKSDPDKYVVHCFGHLGRAPAGLPRWPKRPVGRPLGVL